MSRGEEGNLRLGGSSREGHHTRYVGIDIAKNFHAMGVRTEDGTPHGKAFTFPNNEKGFASFLKRLSELGAMPGKETLLVMESTGHYWLALWEFAVANGYDVAVTDPVLTDAFRKADTLRKTKTDSIDAFLIAEYARLEHLGPSRASPQDAEGLKQPARYRASLARERTSPENGLTAVADRTFPELAKLVGGNDSATMRALMSEYGSAAAIAKTDVRRIASTIKKASRGHYGREKADEVKAAAKASVGTTFAAEALARGRRALWARSRSWTARPGSRAGRPGSSSTPRSGGSPGPYRGSGPCAPPR